MAKTVTVKIARTDGKEFKTRHAQIETTILDFDANDTATLEEVRGRQRLTWIVTGKPGEYQVQITTPEEAVDAKANSRKRRIDQDEFGAGQRLFEVSK